MADITPNPELRKKRLKFRILELELNMERMDVRKAEMDEEKAKIDENLTATQKAIDDIKKELGE